MICSRLFAYFDYSPYILLYSLRLELCGCVCGPTFLFTFATNLFHHSPTFLLLYLLSFYDFSRRSAEDSDSSVFIYAFMQFWSDRRCSKEFFMSKILARAFSGGFRLFVLGRDRSSEGRRDGWRGAGMEGGVERKNGTEKKLVAKKKRRKRNERTGSRII